MNLTIHRSEPHSMKNKKIRFLTEPIYRFQIKCSALCCEAVVKILVQFANVLELNLKEIQRKRPRVFCCRLVGSFHTHPFSGQLRQLTLPSSLFFFSLYKRDMLAFICYQSILGRTQITRHHKSLVYFPLIALWVGVRSGTEEKVKAVRDHLD